MFDFIFSFAKVQNRLKLKMEVQGRYLERIFTKDHQRSNTKKLVHITRPKISMPTLCDEDMNSDDHESNTKELSFESDLEAVKSCTEIQSHQEDQGTKLIPATKKLRFDENVDIFSPRLLNLASFDSEFLAQNMFLLPEADHMSSFHWNIINNIEACPSLAVPSFL